MPELDLSAPPAGRPLKFKSVQELQQKIEEYFGDCDPHMEERLVIRMKATNSEQYSAYQKVITEQKPYTIHGLARALDTTRETLLDYESGKYDDRDMDPENKQSFSDTISRAKGRIAEFAEGMLYVSGASHGAQFNLKNNYGWVDESTVNNKNRVVDDLDALDDRVDLDEEKAAVAAEAAKALEENNGPGSTPQQQVVAPEPPVQNP